jgi:IS30 family transposase
MKKQEGFRHLREKDRDRIHALWGYGHNQSDVARVLGVDKGTISRELARYGRKTRRYCATRAQEDADQKRARSKRSGMKIEENPELKRYIIKQLRRLRSPDEIAGHLKRVGREPRIGTNAIYKWLYSEDGKPYCRYLCTKRKRKKSQRRAQKKASIPDRISLRDRPNWPNLVHSERDLFVSPIKTHSRACGLLIVVPEVKLFAGSILPNRESATVVASAKEHFESLHVDTTLADNGTENVKHKEIGVPSYFCDKGSPWQKPYVEGGIGLVRRWFLPKGTDLATIPDEVFQSQLHLFNHKRRKSLGYRSAYEVALARGIIDHIPRISLTEAVAFR